MKKASLLTMIACASIMTGCLTVNNNKIAEAYDAVVEPARFQTVVEHKQNIVSAEASINVLFGVFKWGASEYADRSFDDGSFTAFKSACDAAKEAATFNACKANNCDVILNAKYTVDVSDYFVFKKVNCKVEGFPGVVKGLKAID